MSTPTEGKDEGLPSQSVEPEILKAEVASQRRLRRFAYVALSIVILGVIGSLVIGVINTVSLHTQVARVTKLSNDNHQLLTQSTNGAKRGAVLFNQAIGILIRDAQAGSVGRAKLEQRVEQLFRANHFRIPPDPFGGNY